MARNASWAQPGDSAAGGVPAVADWALMSKHPNEATGYDILAASGPPRAALAFIRDAGTGNPQGECAGEPESLPWLTFSPGNGEPVASIVEVSWSREYDEARRTIIPSRMVSVPWQRAAEIGATYANLAYAFKQLDWTAVDAGPDIVEPGQTVPLRLQPLDADLLADSIDGIDYDWVAMVAASLLDGDPLVITADKDDDYPLLEDRIAVLDAISALLPYGCRAWLSAATWGSERTRHRVLLTFGRRASDYQRQITWRHGQSVPRTPVGSDYLRELRELREDGISIAEIVRHLALDRAPRTRADGGLALARLRELRLPEAIYREIVNGVARPLRVVQYLDERGGWSQLSDIQRHAYVMFLAAAANSGQPEATLARDGLVRHWAPRVWQALVAEVQAAPWEVNLGRIAGWVDLALLSRDPDGPEELLIALANSPVAGSEAPVADAIWRLSDRIERRTPPLYTALAGKPRLGVAFLGRAMRAANGGSENLFRTELDRFQDGSLEGRTRWLRPLLAAVGQPVAVMQSDLLAIDDVHQDAPRLLLELAARYSTAEALLGFAWPWLAKITLSGSLRAADRHLVLAPPDAGPATLARLDVLAMAAFGELPNLSAHRCWFDAKYLDAFRVAWTDAPMDAGPATAKALIEVFEAHGLDGNGPRQLLMGVIDTVLPAGRPQAAAAIGRAIRADLFNHVYFDYTEIWVRDISAQPGLSRFGPLRALLREAVAQAEPAVMARLCVTAVEAGTSEPEIRSTLTYWMQGAWPERALRLLDALRELERRPDIELAVKVWLTGEAYGAELGLGVLELIRQRHASDDHFLRTSYG